MRIPIGVLLMLGAATIEAHADWSQQPTGYRRVAFGATRAAAMATLENLNVCTKDTGAGVLACTDGRDSFRLGSAPIKEKLFFPADQLVQVTLEYSSDTYAFIRSVFIEKFGEPHRTIPSDFQTKSGARFGNEKLIWEGSDVVVILERFSGDVDHGRATLMTKEFRDSEERRVDREREKAVAAF